MTSFWWLIFFFTDEFFRLESVLWYTNTNGEDSQYTNAIDISIIWLYWRLHWRLYCRLYWRLFCRLYSRLYWRLFFVMQFFFFLFFISAASLWPWVTRPGCFSRVILFFFFCHFYLTQNLQRNLFWLVP